MTFKIAKGRRNKGCSLLALFEVYEKHNSIEDRIKGWLAQFCLFCAGLSRAILKSTKNEICSKKLSFIGDRGLEGQPTGLRIPETIPALSVKLRQFEKIGCYLEPQLLHRALIVMPVSR